MAQTLDLGAVKPIKGQDYWTEEEKAEIVQEVLDQLSLASGVSF